MKYARELTALVGAPILIWIIGWGNAWVFDAAMTLAAGLALYEFLLFGRKKGYDIPVALCLGVMAFIMAAFVLEPVSVEMAIFLTLLIIPAWYVFANISIDEALGSSAISVMATAYVGMLGGSLIRLRNDFPV